MAKINLSPFERMVLINQLEIRKTLAEVHGLPGAEDFERDIEILEFGVPSLIEDLFGSISTNHTDEEHERVRKHLRAFRIIEGYYIHGTAEQREFLESNNFLYDGYDHHDDYYHYADLIINKLGLYTELKHRHTDYTPIPIEKYDEIATKVLNANPQNFADLQNALSA